MKTKYINEQGFCPRCKSGNLNYEAIRLENDMCYFPYICNDCGQQGEEWYRLEFAGHNIITEEGENIEL